MLDQFYKKRKSLITRFFLIAVAIPVSISILLNFNKDEKFIARVLVEGIIQDRKDLIQQRQFDR